MIIPIYTVHTICCLGIIQKPCQLLFAVLQKPWLLISHYYSIIALHNFMCEPHPLVKLQLRPVINNSAVLY